MAKFVNLTPHPVRIADANGNVLIEIPSSMKEFPAVRAIQDNSHHLFEVDGIPVVEARFGSATWVPPMEPNTFYIVSSITASALAQMFPNREDFLVPDTGDDCIRDEKGQPYASKRFLCYAKS